MRRVTDQNDPSTSPGLVCKLLDGRAVQLIGGLQLIEDRLHRQREATEALAQLHNVWRRRLRPRAPCHSIRIAVDCVVRDRHEQKRAPRAEVHRPRVDRRRRGCTGEESPTELAAEPRPGFSERESSEGGANAVRPDYQVVRRARAIRKTDEDTSTALDDLSNARAEAHGHSVEPRREHLVDVKVPVLFMVGEFDESDPPTVKRLAEMTPRARYVVIPGAAHVVQWDAPEETNRVIGAFLRSVDSTKAKP
jgi:pimeloyl-ACP methyl ester carboxylesterase